MIRVLVCDESALFRRHLVLALERVDDVEVIGEAPDADVARSAALQNAPDVVVLGGHLPPIGGVRTAAALRESNPSIGMAFVYDPDDEREEREIRRALRVGFTAVIPRGSSDQAVVAAARALVAGRPVLDAAAAQVVLADYRQLAASEASATAPPPMLDPREERLLEQLAQGASVGDSARLFGLAPTTASNLVANALRKLQRWARAAARERQPDSATPDR